VLPVPRPSLMPGVTASAALAPAAAFPFAKGSFWDKPFPSSSFRKWDREVSVLCVFSRECRATPTTLPGLLMTGTSDSDTFRAQWRETPGGTRSRGPFTAILPGLEPGGDCASDSFDDLKKKTRCPFRLSDSPGAFFFSGEKSAEPYIRGVVNDHHHPPRSDRGRNRSHP